ncbi:MAG: TolC family protein [Fuerstiella sp.]|nr:TolC family protein [Fuerstiella sp.]
MSRRSDSDSTAYRQGLRILSSGPQLRAVSVVTVILSLLYCTVSRRDEAIAASEGKNPVISVKLRSPQLGRARHQATVDQPYPGLQIVARQKIGAVPGPIIRPRSTYPGKQRIGRSRAVFTTPSLTIQQPSPRTPMAQQQTGIPVKAISAERIIVPRPTLSLPAIKVANVQPKAGTPAALQNVTATPAVPMPADKIGGGPAIATTNTDESKQVDDIEVPKPAVAPAKESLAAPQPEAPKSAVKLAAPADQTSQAAEPSKPIHLTLPGNQDASGSPSTTSDNPSGHSANVDKPTDTSNTESPGVPQQQKQRSPVPHHSFQDVDLPARVQVRPQTGSHWGHSYTGPIPGTSGYRATIENDADLWMSPYADRADQAAGSPALATIIPALTELPPGFRPWWDATVRQSTGLAKTSVNVDVNKLLQDAMLYSPQVIAIQTKPEVQYRVVTQEAAKFDWSAFLEATYDDLNDPIGNELTTNNGATRLLTRKAVGTSGFRKKNLHGGELRIAQNIGHENQNSSFFVPNNQGTARFELSYRQPLLDGAGRAYNESEIVLAQIQANSSEDEVVDALQDHLIKVTEAYWTLYRARAEFLQRQKLFRSSREVLTTLKGRNQVDTIPRQILRAKAAVARSQTGIQRTVARVRDAEAQLRLLVNSPEMLNGGPTELTPVEPPGMITENSELRDVLHTALVNRTDISEAIRKMRASGVQLGVSRTELLPRLDFLVKSYVSDLTGGSNVGRSYRDQFQDNRPGVTVGFEFEIPLGNRAAQAKYEQRQWELKRSVNVFRATVEKSLTDVEIANREVATAYSEMQSRFQAMSAAENETAYLQDRFDVLPMVEDSATLLLEDLLDSFERLADEEAGFVQALVDHAIAIVKLKKEIGILLRSRNSSPIVDSSEQQWMSGRVNEAVDGRTTNAKSKPFLGNTDELPVEANVPRALLPEKADNAGQSYRFEVPKPNNRGWNPHAKADSPQAASPTVPRRAGGHTL